MARKIFLLMLSLIMMLSLSACGASGSGSSGQQAQPAASTGTHGGKVLIAYFSHTGTTERVAREIQKLTGGDLFKIETVQPYPEVYRECTERAKAEKTANARPELKGTMPELKNYDVVFIGYPIWWYSAPMAVYTFMESCDFTGKTVVPFCTSGGSSLSSGLDDFKKMAAKGRVLEGLTANRTEDIEPWIKKLGLQK